MLPIVAGALAALAWLQLSCSTPSKTEHAIRYIFLNNLHYRRPLSAGANPRAYPDWPDYVSTPRPNKNFDCQPWKKLFQGIDLAAVRACLAENAGSRAFYRLKRAPVPSWELDRSDLAPSCLGESLPRIPIPREIVFQSDNEGRVRCYISRLGIEDDEIFGLKARTARVKLTLSSAISLAGGKVPDTDFGMRRLLLTWALGPFFNPETFALRSKIFPDEFCRACIGETHLVKETGPLPAAWP